MKNLENREFANGIVTACKEGMDIGYSSIVYREYNWKKWFKPTFTWTLRLASSLVLFSTTFSLICRIATGCLPEALTKVLGVIHDFSKLLSQSINHHINIAEYHMHYFSLHEVVSHSKHVVQHALLAKLDLESAFKYIPVHEQDWDLFGYTAH